MRAAFVMTLIGSLALAGCGRVTFGDIPEPTPVPADVGLERGDARQRAEAERLRRCQMGETGVRRDDRQCRDGVPK